MLASLLGLHSEVGTFQQRPERIRSEPCGEVSGSRLPGGGPAVQRPHVEGTPQSDGA